MSAATSHPSLPLRVAAAQARSVPGDIDANVAAAVGMVEAAAADGARLIVFPEKFLTGYEPDLIRADPLEHAVQANGDSRLDALSAACRDTGVVAVVGTAVHQAGELFVSALVVGSAGVVSARYDKQWLFPSERALYRPGDDGLSLDVDGWRLGLGICYDAGFPEHARAAALSGCHAYVVGALFGVGNGRHESRTWFPARACDNTMYAVLANHVGTTGGWQACGGSAVWDATGRLVAEAGPSDPALVVVELDPEHLRRARQNHSVLAALSAAPARPSVTVVGL
ncbi:carbon-nitrogen hydrolase family protein [Streptomyces sp. NPDC001595]|uniref:carbon-nitrogen hydrolase family protein n=1 Tax=Streptomyces sp. NPDC001532 TaxID=3154520 RepID=UPI003323A029